MHKVRRSLWRWGGDVPAGRCYLASKVMVGMKLMLILMLKVRKTNDNNDSDADADDSDDNRKNDNYDSDAGLVPARVASSSTASAATLEMGRMSFLCFS